MSWPSRNYVHKDGWMPAMGANLDELTFVFNNGALSILRASGVGAQCSLAP